MKIENALNSEITRMLDFRKTGAAEPPVDQILGMVKQAKGALSDSFGAMKARLATEGGNVDTTPIKGYADSILKLAEEGKRPLSDSVKQAARELRDLMSKDLTADDLDMWRRNLNGYIEKARDNKDTADQIKYLQDMKTVFDNSLDAAIETNASPELKTLYRTEQAKYADAMKSLGSDTMVKIAKDPTLLGRMFAQGSQDIKVGEIYSAVTKAAEINGVNPRDAIKNMQAGYLEQLLKLPQSGELSVATLATVEKKLRDPRVRSTMEAVMGKFGAKRLDDILYTSKLAKEGDPKGMLELIIAGKQSQALGNIATLGAVGAAGAVGGGAGAAGAITLAMLPKLLSYVAVDPKRTNEFLKLDKLLREAPEYGFKKAAVLARVGRFIQENEDALFGARIAQDEEGMQQANPMFNPMQSTMQ
jgi:negative regulator of replication initiation